jgi:hypothetical protein
MSSLQGRYRWLLVEIKYLLVHHVRLFPYDVYFHELPTVYHRRFALSRAIFRVRKGS